MSRATDFGTGDAHACTLSNPHGNPCAYARLDIRALTWSGNPNESRDLRKLLEKHGKLNVERGVYGPAANPPSASGSLAPHSDERKQQWWLEILSKILSDNTQPSEIK